MIVIRPSGARGDIIAAIGACNQYIEENGSVEAPILAVPHEMVGLAQALYVFQVLSLGSLEYIQKHRGQRNSKESIRFWENWAFSKFHLEHEVVILWCPATLYEGSTLKSPPDYNRYQLFALAIGCREVQHLPVKGSRPCTGNYIGIAPRATHKLRCIPQQRATELVNLAKKDGSEVLYFDSIRKYDFDDVEYEINLPIAELIERLLECSTLIAADSFMFHLAHFLGVPIYPVFGPTDVRVYRDFPDTRPVCRPCFNIDKRKSLTDCGECVNIQKLDHETLLKRKPR